MNNKNIISNKFDLFWTTTFSYTAVKKFYSTDPRNAEKEVKVNSEINFEIFLFLRPTNKKKLKKRFFHHFHQNYSR
jgi:hypothetical protein